MLIDSIRSQVRSHKGKAKLAREAKVDLPALYRFAKGSSGISLAALDRICQVLGLSVVAREGSTVHVPIAPSGGRNLPPETTQPARPGRVLSEYERAKQKRLGMST